MSDEDKALRALVITLIEIATVLLVKTGAGNEALLERFAREADAYGDALQTLAFRKLRADAAALEPVRE